MSQLNQANNMLVQSKNGGMIKLNITHNIHIYLKIILLIKINIMSAHSLNISLKALKKLLKEINSTIKLHFMILNCLKKFKIQLIGQKTEFQLQYSMDLEMLA